MATTVFYAQTKPKTLKELIAEEKARKEQEKAERERNKPKPTPPPTSEEKSSTTTPEEIGRAHV